MSIQSIDCKLYDIYSDLVDKDFDEKEKALNIVNQILDLYDPVMPVKSPKVLPEVIAFCKFTTKNPMYIPFKAGQRFFVLLYLKHERAYIVSTNRDAPFKFGALAGKVPSYYFNKAT
jgi:hypothetical protein